MGCCCSNSTKSEEKKSLLDNEQSQVIPKNGSWFDEDKIGSIGTKQNILEPQQPSNIPKHRRHSSRVSASGDIVENIMKTLQLEPDQKSLAIRAVLASHNESEQAATEWINKHKFDKDVNKPITEKFKLEIQNEMEQELISKVTQKIDDKHLKFKTESKDKDNDDNDDDNDNDKKKKKDDMSDKETMNEILSNWNTEIIVPFKSNNLIKNGCFIDNNVRLNKCYHIQRVIFILKIYDEWRERFDENNKFSSTLNMIDIIESLPLYSIIALMNDFLHLNECHNYNDKKYEILLEFTTTNLGSCIIGICDKFARNYRDKEICDKDDQQRKNTYFGYLSSDSVYLCQLLDSIHCLLIHSDKNGYKMRQKLIQQIRNNTDDDKKEENVINIDTRFITMILKNNLKKKGDIGSLIIGERFYFWESYKNKIDEKYFNIPKYENLREEMFENGLYRISQRMWNDTIQKARKWKETLRGKQFIAKDYENMCSIYGIPPLSPISISHLLSMLFYTNYEYLQYEFKNKGCCNNLDFQILKQNNIEIGCWYKLFTECICLYGEIPSSQQYKNQTIYYHALNKQTLFSNFNPIFKCMISTTKSSIVIQNAFNLNEEIERNGIILSLQQNSMSLNDLFMDCSFMSDHPLQQEIIFYSSKSLYIIDIMEIHSEPSEYINGFLLFHCIFDGKYFIDNCHNNNYLDFQSSLLSMIDNEIKNENECHVKIDKYIQSQFRCYLENNDKTKWIIKSEYMNLDKELQHKLLIFNMINKSNDFHQGLLIKHWRKILNKNKNKDFKIKIVKEYKFIIKNMKLLKKLQIDNDKIINGQDIIYPLNDNDNNDNNDNNIVLGQSIISSKTESNMYSLLMTLKHCGDNIDGINIEFEVNCKKIQLNVSSCNYSLKQNQSFETLIFAVWDLKELNSIKLHLAVKVTNVVYKK